MQTQEFVRPLDEGSAYPPLLLTISMNGLERQTRLEMKVMRTVVDAFSSKLLHHSLLGDAYSVVSLTNLMNRQGTYRCNGSQTLCSLSSP
jgi:hypothetical protein